MESELTRLYPVLVGGKRGQGGKYGYIDEQGDLVVAAKYDSAGPFSEGLAVVGNFHADHSQDPVTRLWRQHVGVINLAGEEVVPPRYDQVRDYSEGRAALRVEKKWGFLDATGVEVMKPEFAMADSFSEGIAVVETGPQAKRMQRAIDPGGNVLFEKKVNRLGACHDGLMLTATANRWSYLDRSGNTAFELACTAAEDFSEGLAAVLVKGLMGYIDTMGKMVIQPQFPQSGPFREGLATAEAPVAPGSKDDDDGPQRFGYADRTGAMAVEAKYDFCMSFSGGLAPVKTGVTHSYIDPAGKTVIPPIKCQFAWPFVGALAMIRVGDEEEWYINREGKFVWPLRE